MIRSNDPLSTNNNSEMNTIDIILLGDFRVGKTSLAKKIKQNNIQKNQHPTIAIQFHSIPVTTKGNDFNVKLWDTSGQNKYRKIALEYLQKIQSAVVVFDVTKYQTYHIAKQWINQIRQFQQLQHTQTDHIPIVLFGNKTDLCLSKIKEVQNLRQVKKKDIQQYVEKNNILYGQGCAIADNQFKKIIYTLIQKFFLPNQLIIEGQQQSKNCCC